jgi:hypothetical protein
MALQEFAELTAGEPSLLRQVELIVLASHRRLCAEKGRVWSEPIAYHWLRYEDPMPVARLADGVRRLLGEGATLDRDAVDKACAAARIRGFSY